jgi:hypothetical protein
MALKVKRGHNLISSSFFGYDNDLGREIVIINLIERWTYRNFSQRDNRLIIHTELGIVELRFSGKVPKLELCEYCKNQIIFTAKEKDRGIK